MTKKFDEHMEIISKKFQDLEAKISTDILNLGDDLKSHINKENLRRIKNDALAQMEAVREKVVYIEEFRGKKVRGDRYISIYYSLHIKLTLIGKNPWLL